jgi:SRSO17 transposase
MDMEYVKATLERELAGLMEKIGICYADKRGYEHAMKYIMGLLSPIERKNGWQLAQVRGDKTPYAVQQFLFRGRWSADELRDCLQAYVRERLGDANGVLIVDETGFLKKGKKSAGVMRQYSGTAGRVENSQVGVFLQPRVQPDRPGTVSAAGMDGG